MDGRPAYQQLRQSPTGCGGERPPLRLQRVGCYDVGKAIGRGNFATVYLATHNIAKTKVALKVVDKSTIEPENLIKVEREIAIMKTLDHPHIVKLYEVMRTERFIYITTEYCRGGELFEALVERGRITEEDAKRWFHQTCAAVLFCHERRVVHRDLKAENILLDKNGDVKIIDFGFANRQQSGQLLNTWCGSPPYAAPELLLGNDYDGTKSDVWSLGVLLYILVTGGFPFPGESIDKLKRAVLSGQLKIPFWVSVECSDLLRKMLVLIPEARYSVSKVINHRWLHGAGATTKTASPSSQRLAVNAALLSGAGAAVVGAGVQNGGGAPAERKPPLLNKTIVCFMQQHAKWSEDLITEEVMNRNYDGSIFPTYEILSDKLKGRKVDSDDSGEHPRRGSRGSILSGKVNVEPEPEENMIPTADLVQLNLSTDAEDDSADSSNSDSDQPLTYRKRRRRQLRNAVPFDDPSNANRRHTLCASEQLLSPLLNQFSQIAALQQAQLVALAQQAQLFAPFPGFLPGAVPTLPALGEAIAHRGLPGLQTYERRASASDSLFPGVALLSQLGQPPPPPQPPQNLPLPGSSKAPTIEEEGHRYLSQRGGKRNTVHVVGGTPLSAGGSPSIAARHLKSPYPKPTPTGAERRSSWASPSITTQQAAHLDRIYRRAVQGGGDRGGSDSLNMIKQLQLEFQALGRLTQQQCSPTGAYAQHSPGGSGTGAGGSALAAVSAAAAAASGVSTTPSLTLGTAAPRISITDENNRSLACASATFDPIAQFNQQANEIIYGQRPATVIGFSPCGGSAGAGATPPSTACNNNGFSSSAASSPDRPLARPVPQHPQPSSSPEANSKMLTFALTHDCVVQQIRAALEESGVAFEQKQEVVQGDRELTHFAIAAHGVDIAVAAVPGEEQLRAHVEMMCASATCEEHVEADPLCGLLLQHLRAVELGNLAAAAAAAVAAAAAAAAAVAVTTG